MVIIAAFVLTTMLIGVSGQKPVKVDLYYETLCPYSIDYFTNQLYPTYQQLKDIMDVSLYPFGNAEYQAKPGGGWTFTCQHGNRECRGNMIHACAQNYITDFDVEMDFVQCLLTSINPPLAGEKCAAETNVDWTPIDSCINSVEGEEALHAVALEQEKLDPALYFVPWILVDDVFSETLVSACQTNMKAVVCSRYTGPKPDACVLEKHNFRHSPRISPLIGKTLKNN